MRGTGGLALDPFAVLFPKTRRAVLGLLYSHPDEAFYLREIVDRIGLAVGQVQRELALLVSAGVVTRFEQGRHAYFRADESCVVFDELRGIVTKALGAASVLSTALSVLSDRVVVAFIFGSVARGEEVRSSDLDLMVVGDASFAEIAEAVREPERVLGRQVNISVYPPRELATKINEGHHFLAQVIRGEKVYVMGGPDELDAVLAQPVDPQAHRVAG
jgi:predicted nucleotidyltransferase